MVVKKEDSQGMDKLVRQLMQNSVTLQSKTVDIVSNINKLVASTNDLNKKIDSLLRVFETAAKHVSETRTTEEQINALAMKLESLLDQNKNIARGLLLLEQYVRGKSTLAPGKPLTQY